MGNSKETKEPMVSALNVRGIDINLYNNFKSTLYKKGYKDMKSAIVDLMEKFVCDN
jgi:hypothetical protein